MRVGAVWEGSNQVVGLGLTSRLLTQRGDGGGDVGELLGPLGIGRLLDNPPTWICVYSWDREYY